MFDRIALEQVRLREHMVEMRPIRLKRAVVSGCRRAREGANRKVHRPNREQPVSPQHPHAPFASLLQGFFSVVVLCRV